MNLKYLSVPFLVLNIIFAPIFTQAHYTGYTHHETIFKYQNNHILADYNLNLTYPDFQTNFPKVDANQDGFISADEAKTWLDTWKNEFYIETKGQKLIPIKAYDFPTKAEISPDLNPILSFELDFGELKLDNNWQDFKIVINTESQAIQTNFGW